MRLPPHRQLRTVAGTDLVAVDWTGAGFTELRLVLPSIRTDSQVTASAQLLGRLLPLGPADAGAAEHEERVLGHGVGLRSTGTVDRLTVAATVPPGELAWTLDELLERITCPAYTAGAVADAVRTEAAALARSATHRETRVHHALARARWGADHPWAVGLPTVEHARTEVTADELAAFARAHLTLERATVVVVGDLGTDGGRRWPDVLDPLLARLEEAGSRTMPAPPPPADPGPRSVPGLLVPVDDDEATASLRLWAPAPPRQHPDHPALHALAMVLGGYFGSRLNQELRERRGDVYGVTTGFEVLATAATFAVVLECPVDRWAGVHSTVLDTVADLRGSGPTVDELRTAVQWSTNAVTVGMGSPAALAGAGASVVFGGDTLGLWDRQAAAAATLTPDDVGAAGERYLAPHALVDLVAAPPARVSDAGSRRADAGRSSGRPMEGEAPRT